MEQNDMTIRELNSLIETHLDAAEVLQEAIGAINEQEVRMDVETMLSEHQNAVVYLQERVRQLGGNPSIDSHSVNYLRESWQKLWQGRGDDKSTLLALRANERVAVDGLQLQISKEGMAPTMTEEGRTEHLKTLDMELGHFRALTDRLRTMGASVDNDEITGAVRNAAEHIYAAFNLSGAAVESFFKWVTGTRTT